MNGLLTVLVFHIGFAGNKGQEKMKGKVKMKGEVKTRGEAKNERGS